MASSSHSLPSDHDQTKSRDDEFPRWSPPREGWLKLNVAVTFSYDYQENMQHAAAGGILRDEKGKLCWAFSYYLGQDFENDEAHLFAIKRSLDILVERRVPMLVVETTNSEAVKTLSKPPDENVDEGHPLAIIILEDRSLVRQPWRTEYVHIRFSANECARLLAELGHSHKSHTRLVEYDAPPTAKLASVVENESLNEAN